MREDIQTLNLVTNEPQLNTVRGRLHERVSMS